jgi:hypothetical protein
VSTSFCEVELYETSHLKIRIDKGEFAARLEHHKPAEAFEFMCDIISCLCSMYMPDLKNT